MAIVGHGVNDATALAQVGIAAISMSGSSVIVAVNALLLKRLRLCRPNDG